MKAILILALMGQTALLVLSKSTTVYPSDGVSPNPTLTPGATDPAVTQENVHTTICKPGYTKAVRNVTQATAKAVFKAYRIDYANHAQYEVDHLISLELGGSNAQTNLWPERYCPLPQKPGCFGARQKDVVETSLHRDICQGKATLADAQRRISTDWLAEYRRIKGLLDGSNTAGQLIVQ